MTVSKRTFVVGIGVMLAAGTGCQKQAATVPAPPPPLVTVVHPLLYPVQSYFEYNGHLEAVETVEIRARVKGLLEEVHFTEGDEVQKGDKLYTIDPREYRTAVARSTADQAKSTAEIDNWKAQIKLAETELARLTRLPPGTVTQSEIDKARATVDVNVAQLGVAQATRDAAAAALQTATIQLGYTDIRAPITGRISRTLINKGNLVGQDQPTLLTTIVSVDPIFVRFDAPERDLDKYQLTMPVKNGTLATARETIVEVGVTTDAGYPHRGRVDFLDNRVDIGTGTIHVRGRLPNPMGPDKTRPLYPGLFARVRVQIGQPQQQYVIPEEAIMASQEGRFVYVVGDGDTVQKRLVTVGTRVWRALPAGETGQSTWAILSLKPGGTAGQPTGALRQSSRAIVAIERGLHAGDRVVVNGLQRARPGAPVTAELRELRAPENAADPKR